MAQPRTRVLIVDDSSVVRSMIRAHLARHPLIEVVGHACDGEEALARIRSLRPDVVTLDIEMPRMNGIEVLERVAGKLPVAFVMCSLLTRAGAEVTFEALQKGAFDYVAKPDTDGVIRNEDFHAALARKIRAAALAKGRTRRILAASPADAAQRVPPNGVRGWVVGIGISCGGPQTLARVLPVFPADFVPILVTQHMPPGFTAALAAQLDQECAMRVVEARDGDPLVDGTIYIAPGTHHLCLRRTGTRLQIALDDRPKVCGHRPAADVMFDSLARQCGDRCVGVVMTGMGSDGANGIRALHAAGAWTVGQDQATSLVYGMPKVAAATGCLDGVAGMLDLPATVARLLARGPRSQRAEISEPVG